jgi:hypothetical protein
MSTMRTFFAGAAAMACAIGAIASLTGAKAPTHAQFDEITVGRINVVEPDGTRRLIISNRARFPGAFEEGKEIARPDRTAFAGMLFVNDEGTENGGLIQKGSIGPNGRVSAGLSLTFDRFRQDQMLQLLQSENGAGASASLVINDVPAYTVTSSADRRRFDEEAAKLPAAERGDYWKGLAEAGRLGQGRIYLGTTRDRASSLVLNDALGRPRMMLLVSAAGEPQIQMLDETGKVVKTVAAD